MEIIYGNTENTKILQGRLSLLTESIIPGEVAGRTKEFSLPLSLRWRQGDVLIGSLVIVMTWKKIAAEA